MPSKSAPYWQQAVLAVLVAAAVVAFNVWTVLSVTPPAVRLFGDEQGDYSNLVMRGLLKGHTYLDVAPPAALVQARNPYDPATRPPGPLLSDSSLYKGHYYVYFGVAPVVTLFLPWRLAFGHDLPAPYAALILVNGAFLASAGLWWMLRRRYFPDSGLVALVTGILVIGLGSMTHSVLRRTSIWEPPVAAGYLFAVLCLSSLYLGLHGRRRTAWFSLASLFLGLAVGSRPTYVVGAAALAVPLAAGWLRARGQGRGQIWQDRVWRAQALALALPFTLIVAALLGYNYARFDNPFEFGMRYQLTGTYEAAVRHFSAAYVRFNAFVYYWARPQWSRYFPFVEPIRVPPAPAGYETCEYVYGILWSIPFAWAALAAPLALMRRRRSADERGILGEFLGSLAALYASLALFLLFFVTSAARYMLDFVPALMLLACVGLLSVERVAPGRFARSAFLAVAAGAGLFSVLVCAMLNFQLQDLLRQLNPPLFRTLAHAFDEPAWRLEQRAGTRFGPLELTLRFPPGRTGRTEPLVSTGWEFYSDYLFVDYVDARSLRIGYVHAGYPTRWSQPLGVDYAAEHHLRIQMGSLFPPRAHPFFDGLDDLQYGSVCRWLRVELDGRVALDGPQDFYDASPESLRIGAEPTNTYGGRFTGRIASVARGRYSVAPSPSGPCGPLELTLSIPHGATSRQVPLVTTGAWGRGDALLLRAVRPGVVRFYYDHWGSDLIASPDVPITAADAHELIVSMPSLWSGRSGPDSPLARSLYVALDGHLIALQPVPWFPAGRGEVALARNGMDSSLCEPEYPWAVGSVIPNIPLAPPGPNGASAGPWTAPAERVSVQREASALGERPPAVDAQAARTHLLLTRLAWAWAAAAAWILGRLAGIRWAAVLAWLLLAAARPLRRPAAWAWRHRLALALAALAAAAAGEGWRRRVAYLQAVGPVRIRLMLPGGLWTRQQPILCTGRPGAGAMVYVRYSDKDHIQLDADIWGSLYQSEAIPVDYAQPQDIEINASGLYPLDHPGVRTMDPDTLGRLRSDFFVALGGRTVLSVPRLAYDSTASEFTVGANRIQSSFTAPAFTGRVLSVERLSFVRELRVAGGQAVRLRFRLDPAAGERDQPLLSLGQGGNLGLCLVRPGSPALLCYRSADGAVTESAPLPGPAGAWHTAEIVPGYGDSGEPVAGVQMSADGVQAPPPRGFTGYASCPAVVGIDPAAPPGAGQFFGSPDLGAALVTLAGAAQERASTGGQSLLVRFPGGETGSDPVVVSGVTGAGDFLYVSFLSGNRLQFGFDHWGAGGGMGEPVAFDPNHLHRLQIETAGLRPLAAGVAAAAVQVKLDGRVVLEAKSPIHPHTEGQIYLGTNPIGGSTCGLVFRGEILDSRPE